MVPSEQCRRCREWVSVGLDVPLSQFEQALLRRHLDACPACADFAADVRGATALLRAAEPVAPRAPIEVPVPRRIAPKVAARTGMALAAAAAAVAALSTSGLTGGSQLVGGPAAQAASSAEIPAMRLIRSQQLRPLAKGPANIRIRVIEVD